MRIFTIKSTSPFIKYALALLLRQFAPLRNLTQPTLRCQIQMEVKLPIDVRQAPTANGQPIVWLRLWLPAGDVPACAT